jgi:hypothetical protein
MGLLPMLGNPFIIASVNLLYGILILKLHKLEESLATFERYTVNGDSSMAKITKYAPFFIFLVDDNTLICRIGLYAPVFRVVLADKLGYAIETHNVRC